MLCFVMYRFRCKVTKKTLCKLTGENRHTAFFTGAGIQIKVGVWRRACIFLQGGQYYYRDEAEIWHKPKENTLQSAVTEFNNWLQWFENPEGKAI